MPRVSSLKRSLRIRKSSQFPSPNDVTEGSLQVWRDLPTKIRQDPSLASFQLEYQRSHGSLPGDEPIPVEEIEMETEDDVIEATNERESEFINMKAAPTHHGERIRGHGHSSDAMTSVGGSHHASHRPSFVHFVDHHNSAKEHASEEASLKEPDFKKYTKIIFLLIIWLIGATCLAASKETNGPGKQVVIPEEGYKYFMLCERPSGRRFSLTLQGAFLKPANERKNDDNFLNIQVQIVKTSKCNNTDVEEIETIADRWSIPIVAPHLADQSALNTTSRKFDFTTGEVARFNSDPNHRLRLIMSTNNKKTFAYRISYNYAPVDLHIGTIYAAGILILFFVLVIWEIVHRTFASMICSVLAIGIMSALGDRPTMDEIVKWMDAESIMLLFCMMILVAILTETGVFDYLAVVIFKISNGKIWPLIHCLCIVTCFISSILDNVTTVLLMTPVTIKLCEVMSLDPVPVLMGIIIHANVGGTLTPIGDPPNVIITTNNYVSHHGVTFFTFIEHMILGVLLVSVQSCIQLRFTFRDTHALRLKEPIEIKQLRREIMIWKRSAASLSSYSKDVDLVRETLLKKVKILKHKLHKLELEGTFTKKDYRETLEELTAANPIKNKPLLIKSGFVMVFVITLFFVQSVPSLQRLSLGWVAVLGVILLCIIADRDDMDAMMARMEWTTLLFFATMFVTMEALQRLGLVDWIGGFTERIILSVPAEHRLGMAIFLILWISALSSAFVESIMITAMMLKLVVSLAENSLLELPLQPLVWALAFGPCLGGNGTLYGNSANVVCAGIAEQNGYDLNFSRFFKVGFPMMIGSAVVITGYLMLAHVVFAWH